MRNSVLGGRRRLFNMFSDQSDQMQDEEHQPHVARCSIPKDNLVFESEEEKCEEIVQKNFPLVDPSDHKHII